MSWTFQGSQKMGGATGEAFSNVLTSTGMAPEAVLAREAIQNSVDAFVAAGANAKPRVAFRRDCIDNKAKEGFLAALQLAPELKEREPFLDLPEGNCVSHLDDPRSGLELLYIDDYGTHGLYGDPHDSASPFYRLLLFLGDSAKARTGRTSGGSYGYGKGVYSANSRIHTIVAYSVFLEDSNSTATTARIMACSYFKEHGLAGSRFTGRAWFGIPESTTEQGIVVHPFKGEQAHDLATALGFVRRDRTECGTSILLIDCPVEVDALRDSIEDWWWPRLIEDSLDVELYDHGVKMDPPRPRKRDDLKPFIRCFDMAVGTSTPTGRHDKANELNRLNGVPLGSVGFTILDADQEVDGGLVNRLAFIRTPKMVVAYHNVGSLSLPYVGVFVSSPEVDEALKLSEPPAHDRWDQNSPRLHEDTSRAQVKAVLQRVRFQLKGFVKDATPPAPDGNIRLSQLERMLGSILRPPPSPAGQGGGAPADPIEILFLKEPQRQISGAYLTTTGEFQVRLAKKADRDDVELIVRLRCVPVEDEGLSNDEPIKVRLRRTDSQGDTHSSEGEMPMRLSKSEAAKFGFITEPYHRDWATKVFVEVSEVP